MCALMWANTQAARRLSLIAALGVAIVLVVSATAGARTVSSELHGPARIRVANFYLVGGSKPGPALDFYDTQQPRKSDKPLISNLGYGQVSAYVTPREDAGYSNLYIYPAGSKTWGKPFDDTRSGENIASSGWVQGQQETVVMGTDPDTHQPTFATIAEIEPSTPPGYRSALLKWPPGTPDIGLLAVNVDGLIENTAKYGGVDLRIDGKCPDNTLITGKPARDSNNPTTPAALANYNAANFLLREQEHSLDVVAEPGPGQGLSQQQCDAATSEASLKVIVNRVHPALVFIYGPSPAHINTAVARVANG